MCSSLSGYRLKCPYCKKFFNICVSCYKGQKYCSKHCSKKSRLKSNRHFNRQYSKTPKAHKLHRKRQNRYRKKLLAMKKVTEQGSPPTFSNIKSKRRYLLNQQIKPTLKTKEQSCITCYRKINYVISLEVSAILRRKRGYRSRNQKSHSTHVLC